MADLTLSADLDALLSAASNAAARAALGLGTLATQSATITDYLTIAASASLNTTGNAGTVTTINGRIAEGSNVTITGTGTAADPYVIASSGGASGVTVQDEGTPLATSGTTLNFVGDAVTVTGTGATKTITINHQSLAAYAPLASPTFTGTPAAPTASVSTNTTQIATTAFVQAALAALINSAPGALDTLDELAAALGDDANFAATVTTALAGKQSTITFGTGVQTALGVNVGSAGAPVINGGTMTGQTVTGYTETVVAIGNSGTSQTLAITGGTVQTCTLTGNCTFTMPTATAGKSFVLYLFTGAGGFTGTFTGVKWSGGTAPTITATASRMDILTFVADGTNWYGSALQDFTP